MRKFKIRKLLMGHLEYQQLIAYLIIHAIVFISLLLAARFAGSPDFSYSIFSHLVSHLGVESRNPEGYIYFNISFILLGLAYIPVALYIHRRICHPDRLWTARIGTILWVFSAVGIIGIGTFPDEESYSFWGLNLQYVHKSFAYIAIIGFLTGMGCYLLILGEDAIKKQRGKKSYFMFQRFIPSFIAYIVVLLGLSITQYQYSVNRVYISEGLSSRTFWEWMLFILSFFEIYSIALALPHGES